jgi:uncharacterized protein YicC (UPF0701 family)
VECALKLQTAGAALTAITLNQPLVERLLDVAAEVEHMIGPGTGLRLGDVLRWPGVVNEAEPDLDEIKLAILGGLDAALRGIDRHPRTGGPAHRRTAAATLRSDPASGAAVRARRPEVHWPAGATSC